MQTIRIIVILFLHFLAANFGLENGPNPSDLPKQNNNQTQATAQGTETEKDNGTLVLQGRLAETQHPELSASRLAHPCTPPSACGTLESMAARRPTVLIIGSGISGLGAAQKLHKHGFRNLIVLEATARTGGRIRSEKFANGLVEIGAQWIHGPSPENPVFQLSAQYNLLGPEALLEENQKVEVGGHPSGVHIIYSSSGKQVSPELAMSAEELYSSILERSRNFTQGESHANASVGGFIKQEVALSAKGWDRDEADLKMAFLKTLLKLESSVSGTHTMDDVALGPFGEYKMLPGLDCTFPGGYESLINSIKSTLPGDIFKLNKAVKNIHWNGSFEDSSSRSYPVQVKCEDGDTFVADHVIVTVPLGFLKEQNASFTNPPLPPRKVQAIQNLGFGTNNKIIMEFEEPFWDPLCEYIMLVWEGESPLVEPQRDMRRDWVKKLSGFVVLQPPAQLGHVLCGFIAGEEAEFMETLTDEELLSSMTSLLRQFTGDPNLRPPVRIRRTRWRSETYTRGSYSYVAVGSSGRDSEILAQPLPEEGDTAKPLQVLFAGEATHRTFYSTTHGALLSGWREADRLIGQYPGLDSLLSKAKL
ncbi:peroxisomal N(1)-acetyl-spermine/spermidine oxidase [Bombina bombina]|uniref:peroxisomal N(1)-acetyl-spermine/spermidine oxidase n=1 Tax=Bombina bombina TaxID=8345 RepID=UPI00235A9587|nr:peroxisomal N(1)-acetyl-spermine/spermidine oxidase [Bombina bombina]